MIAFLFLTSHFHVETDSGRNEKADDGPCLIDRLKPYQMLLPETNFKAEAKAKPEVTLKSEAKSYFDRPNFLTSVLQSF